jgi:FAD/FMN-containing dehydrogenase
MLGYLTDWYNLYRGSSSVVLLPTSTYQVQAILKYCNEHHIAVVPQSGNTSASGGKLSRESGEQGKAETMLGILTNKMYRIGPCV